MCHYKDIDSTKKQPYNAKEEKMKPVFLDTRVLDTNARERFSLTEKSMMEHAGRALVDEIDSFNSVDSVLILCGGGNNGGDGYVTARLLAEELHGGIKSHSSITICVCAEPKSDMCKTQKALVQDESISYCTPDEVISQKITASVIVDCVFGSGFHGSLPVEIEKLFEYTNTVDAQKIACDVPSGIDLYGNCDTIAFEADVTVTMGALKICLFSDKAKDCAGKIIVADLGVDRARFEGTNSSAGQLLERTDMILPHRGKQNVNKGSFGHAAVVVGQKIGAGVIAGSSAFRFGAGLVSLVAKSSSVETLCPGRHIVLDEDGQLPSHDAIIPYDLMCTDEFPGNTTAVALGMGLGRPSDADDPARIYFEYLNEHGEIPCVLDADIFYSKALPAFLKLREGKNIVLTPHPKEFVSLMQICFSGESLSVQQVIEHKVELMEKFCFEYQNVVLLVKGAVVTIAVKLPQEQTVRLYFNPYGTNALAKGGSGDVLAGMICALLAQKYSPLDATVSASLAHAFASASTPCDFALTPFDLMKEVSHL